MRLVSYLKNDNEQLALLLDDYLYDTKSLHDDLPDTMSEFLKNWDENYTLPLRRQKLLREEKTDSRGVHYNSVQILAPVPRPTSCRDAYAFRHHVAAARRNRKVQMIPEFDQYPVFYFTNHNSIKGPGKVECMPDHFEKLDFELEAAVVICRQGRNIKAEDAREYIGGLMVMNNLSA